MCSLIFLNEQPVSLKTVFSTTDIKLTRIMGPVYNILKNDVDTGLVIKINDLYSKTFTEKEVKYLLELQDTVGIPKLYGHFISPKFSYIIMEKLSGTDLFEHMKAQPFNIKEIKLIIKQLLCIIHELHQKKIIHRDIKGENVMYDRETKVVTLIDFEGKITWEYASPETLAQKKYTEKTDMWSVGIVCYFLLTGNLPFGTQRGIASHDPMIPEKWDESQKEFILNLLQKTDSQRLSAKQAMEHEWLSNV